MITPRNSGGAEPPNGSLLAELDALVLREMEALVNRSRQAAAAADERPTGGARDAAPANVIDAKRWPRRVPPGETALDPPPEEADIVPLGAGPGRRGDVRLLSPEDEAFVEQTVRWLKNRPNADQLLEEVWRLAVPYDEDERATDIGQEDDSSEQEQIPQDDTPPPPSGEAVVDTPEDPAGEQA